MSAGYSGTPLIKKLGIKGEHKVVILGAPTGYAKTLGKLPPGISTRCRVSADTDFIQFFVTKRSVLERRFPVFRDALTASGILWISWPKKTSGLATDLTRDIVRNIGLSAGLVDVKICAVDDTWSGLKFVRRVRDRKLGQTKSTTS